MGWSQLEKTDRSGIWLFRGALQAKNLFLPLTQQGTGNRRERTTRSGRSFVVPRVLVRTRTGKAPLSGRTLESGAGHC